MDEVENAVTHEAALLLLAELLANNPNLDPERRMVLRSSGQKTLKRVKKNKRLQRQHPGMDIHLLWIMQRLAEHGGEVDHRLMAEEYAATFDRLVEYESDTETHLPQNDDANLGGEGGTPAPAA